MAIYRPIKKWLLPLLFAILGLAISLSLFPTKQDAIYKEWTRELTELTEMEFDVETSYVVDEAIYSQSSGHWNDSLAYYEVTTPFSDGSSFRFEVYFSNEKFYINTGNEWAYGEMPHRISNEFIPLDHPFNWIQEFLQEADSITKGKDASSQTYQAVFDDFNDVEFRGIRLQQQNNTILSMTINENGTISISFDSHPVRPEDIGILTSYPDTFSYEIILTESKDGKISLPKDAEDAVLIE